MKERKFLCKVQFGRHRPFMYVSGYSADRSGIRLIYSDEPVQVSSEVCDIAFAVVPYLDLSGLVHRAVWSEVVQHED